MPRAVGLGCMRLATDEAADRERAVRVIRAGLDAGVTLLDTARAYGESEAWIAEALDGRSDVRVVTKCGMRRPRGAWVPDGKQKSLRADAEASRAALRVSALDAVLLHAPDPTTKLATSVRGLEAIRAAGVARAIGLSNVTRGQLDEARTITEIAYVELALSPFDEDAVRGGVVERCLERGITVLAHSPLGGPKRAPSLGKRYAALGELAARRGVSAASLALAWLRDLHSAIIPIPGARTETTATQAARAASIALDDDERSALDALFPIAALVRTPRSSRRPAAPRAEVVVLMGMPAAGKSTRARELEAHGYERLNRDERGGTLLGLARLMEERLSAGVSKIVMDNTYPSRAQRNVVIEAAWAHGARVRGEWLDTAIEDAQVNAVLRMLERHGELLSPEAIAKAAKRDPNTFGPRAQFRFRDALEPPDPDEGFEEVTRSTPVRPLFGDHERPGWIVDLAVLEASPERLAERAPDERVLVLAWMPGADEASQSALRARYADDHVDVGICAHPPGPPICWCRKPMPGLALAWMRAHRIAPHRTRLSGDGPLDRALAARLGVALEPDASSQT